MDFRKTHLEREHKHSRPLISCRFVPGQTAVLFGSEDFRVWKWDWESDTKTEFPVDAWVRGLAVTRDGSTFLSGGYDGRLLWWDLTAETEPPKPAREIEAHDGWLRAVALSPDETLVATVGNDRVLRLWNRSEGNLVRELTGQTDADDGLRHESHVYNVAFHPGGEGLVTGDLMGRLIHWDLKTGQPTRSWTAKSLSKFDDTFRAQIGGFRDLTFDAKGDRLFAAGITNVTNAFAGVGEPSVVEFDWKAGKQLVEYQSQPKLRGVAWGVNWHPSGVVIGVQGGSGGNLMFWKQGESESALQFKLPQNGRDLDLHTDGLLAAAACSDGRLGLYRLSEKSA